MGTATQTARLDEATHHKPMGNVHGVEITDADLPDFTTPIEPSRRTLKITDFPPVEPPQREYGEAVERKQRKRTRTLENAYLADQCLRLAKLVSEVNNGEAYFLAEEILGDLAVPEKRPVLPCDKPKTHKISLSSEEAIRARYETLREKYKPMADTENLRNPSWDDYLKKDAENYWAGLGAPWWTWGAPALKPRKFDAEFLDQRMRQHYGK